MTQQRLDLGMDNMPTTTVHQSRLQLAQPTRRPKDTTRVIETPWGHGTVTGKYGQAHVDFTEAICRYAERQRRCDDEGIELLVDPYKLRLAVGGGKQASWQQIEALKLDVMRVVIDLRGNALHNPVTGHIIDHITESKIKAKTRPGAITANGERWLWYVKLGPAFVRFIDDDLRLYYDPKPIAALNAGVSQAVVRHALTHRHQPPGGWHIDELIKAVGAGGTSKSMWDRRNEVRLDAEGLDAIGFEIKDGRLLKKD